MKIAQINLQRDWGGAERHVSLLSEGLRDAGEQVLVCCHPDGGLLDDACRLKLACAPVAAASQMDLLAAVRLAARLARFRPDIVHLHTPRDYVCGYLASRLVGGAGLALTRHMMLPLRPMMRRIYERAGAVICLSSAMQVFLQREGVPACLLRRVRSGIRTGDFGNPCEPGRRDDLRREWSVGPGEIAIGMVGRMVPWKGHAALLTAWAGAADACHGGRPVCGERSKLVLIGDGPERPRLQEQARTMGVAESVHFAGYRSDIPAVLAALDMFVLPSETEVCPLSVMEAMAAGLPVAATAVGGLCELVETGVTGILVPPNEPRALADCLARLAADRRSRERMGACGRARAAREFTVAAMTGDTIDAYRSILRP